MKVLVTGTAGFIGSFVAQRLLERGDEVVGLDNINDYYDVNLKYGRLEKAGIKKDQLAWYKFVQSDQYPNYRFIQMNLEDKQALQMLFANEKFDRVCHLAAQAGVRYSIENPYAYVQSNIDGFLNILETCRWNNIEHLVYASSSSVYGLNGKVPFSEKDSIAHPVSLYAATKKSNELMAHSYSQLYNLPTTGLRFFTVYGPWGRPDMAYYRFARQICENQPIQVFNYGKMRRDFTYIDDIVEGTIAAIDLGAAYEIFNLGNHSPVQLLHLIELIEEALGKKAIKELLPMQPGEVLETYADISKSQRMLGFTPKTRIEEGIKKFIDWYRDYHLSASDALKHLR